MELQFRTEENRVVAEAEDGRILAVAEFPSLREGVTELTRTYVDPSLRGQGVAGKLMERAVKALRETGRKVKPRCSYAVKWFEERPEHADLLAD